MQTVDFRLLVISYQLALDVKRSSNTNIPFRQTEGARGSQRRSHFHMLS